MMFFTSIISLMFSAFFSGAKIAFSSANQLQLEVVKTQDKFKSRVISFFIRNESEFTVTMLVGKNISLVVFGISMIQILTSRLQFFISSDLILLFLQTIITTVIILVTSEFLPKAVFKNFSNQILSVFYIPIYLVFMILRPTATIFIKISNFLLIHVLRQDNILYSEGFRKKEIDNFLSNPKPLLSINDSCVEVEMLQNALDLSVKRIRDFMIPRTEIVAVDILCSIDDVKNKFIETKFSKLLVFKGNIDRIIGYIHSYDLFKNPKNLKSVLLPLPFVTESMKAMELLNQFIDNNKGVAVVLDEFGGTAGMITIEDVTEEIVGDIIDEHDIYEETDQKIDSATFILLGRSYVEDINRRFDLDLPESEEYTTISGLLLNYLEKIPEHDDVIQVENYHFQIKRVNKTTIQEVKLLLL